MVGKAQKSHGVRSELNSVLGLEKVDQRNPIRTSAIQSKSRPVRFLDFSNNEKGAPRQEISKWSTICITFWRSEWSVVRSASLAKGVLRKRDRHRTSTKFRLGLIRWVHELCKRPPYIIPQLFYPFHATNEISCLETRSQFHMKETVLQLSFSTCFWLTGSYRNLKTK
jgi:hypothetical protein